MAVAKYTEPKTLPKVNSNGRSEEPRSEKNHAKPVAVISMPTRLSGRRAHANRPTPAKPQPTISVVTAQAPRSSRKSLVTIRARSIRPNRKAAPARPQSARRREVTARRL
jgi:hypothetical protein